MAKTLVGLYDSLAEAECVVVDLVEHDFVRIAMRRMLHDAQGQEITRPTREEPAQTAASRELTELGVPVDEARSPPGCPGCSSWSAPAYYSRLWNRAYESAAPADVRGRPSSTRGQRFCRKF
jgi:hypothetical protein